VRRLFLKEIFSRIMIGNVLTKTLIIRREFWYNYIYEKDFNSRRRRNFNKSPSKEVNPRRIRRFGCQKRRRRVKINERDDA